MQGEWHNYEGVAYLGDRELADWLEGLPVLAEAQSANQHIEVANRRVWVERVGVADGMPIDQAISVERYDKDAGKWENGGREDLIVALLSDGRPEARDAAMRLQAQR